MVRDQGPCGARPLLVPKMALLPGPSRSVEGKVPLPVVTAGAGTNGCETASALGLKVRVELGPTHSLLVENSHSCQSPVTLVSRELAMQGGV